MGIFLTDLRIRIDNNTSTTTITNIKTITPKILDDAEILENTLLEIPEIIEAKINKLTPLEIPFSVINSPIRINNIEPTDKVKAVPMTIQKLDTSMTFVVPDQVNK
jgi:hypothetical protein